MRYHTTYTRDGFYFEAPDDADNAVIVSKNKDGGIIIAVSEEQAVDSYNSMFECVAYLPEADAIRLRDYLARAFPIGGDHD